MSGAGIDLTNPAAPPNFAPTDQKCAWIDPETMDPKTACNAVAHVWVWVAHRWYPFCSEHHQHLAGIPGYAEAVRDAPLVHEPSANQRLMTGAIISAHHAAEEAGYIERNVEDQTRLTPAGSQMLAALIAQAGGQFLVGGRQREAKTLEAALIVVLEHQ